MKYLFIGLGIAGLGVITIYGSWQIAAGTFLLLWANNIEHTYWNH